MRLDRLTFEGSSPLARGLPKVQFHRHRQVGIIPARAGFTRHGAQRGDHPPDHPRSRGVYTGGSTATAASSGSSPLARGLLLYPIFHTPTRGIIPARAGFTPPCSPSAPEPQDHPRSRGVYAPPGKESTWDAGSSPLARGLRPIPRRRIPAIPDHPRSRGVYEMIVINKRINRGSSPLARGLHSDRVAHPGASRIIPARAGFTSARGTRQSRLRDHPRSRGVYIPAATARAPPTGSSPLARGLREPDARKRFGRRIIPARAGFTSCPWRTSATVSDHPRSRGVYILHSK